MLKIWGRTNSINVQKPLMVLEELQVPYERIDAGLQFGVNNTPEYLAMNPNGRVPAIDDDGFILWESNTVARYIARKYGNGKLWPQDDVRAQANQDRWMDWQQTTMVGPINAMFAPLIRGMGDKSPEAIEKGRQQSEQVLAMLDAWLANNVQISGKEFGVADCVLGPSVHRWYNLPIAHREFPNLRRWFDALMQRASAKKVIVEPIS
ncbi:MAG: glutathione S-transferase family protein [Beijerinckiaceae bacterium]